MPSTRLGSSSRFRAAWLLGCIALFSCGLREKSRDHATRESYSLGDQPLEPLSVTADFDAARAALGEALFSEPRLSGDSKVACTDCHHADHGLADDKPHSFVNGRPESAVNTPTMYNVRFLHKLSWGGKYDSLEAHIDALMKNPKVMASSWELASQHLSEVASYREKFAAVFSEGLTPSTVRLAILEYERSLITPNAPFDRYLRGDVQAISPEAKQGFVMFKSYGCSSCHQGMAVGGNVFERFGVLRDFFADRGHFDNADLGRFNVTQREQDRFVFRVPSLRNVALTAPYFHDGSAATLEEAVTTMASYQLGRELDDRDRTALVAFLRALTGEYRGKSL
ncbi:MAG: cytochrome c peroxidase [Pseudomonadota bacterium]